MAKQLPSWARTRIPFEVAISDRKLLGEHWKTLSTPQKVVLKAFYGLSLSDEELETWAILQGNCTYDELGYTTGWKPLEYVPKEYHTLVLNVGRRSGKTDRIMSTAFAYEVTLGGHAQYVRPGQEFKALFVAQTIDDAMRNMQFPRMNLEESPLLKEAFDGTPLDKIIRLKNGLDIVAEPPTIKSSRGHAIPVVLLDEFAFWYTNEGAANPDYEVLAAVRYSMAQFPHAKKLLGTTPWVEEGLAYKYSKAGTEGRLLKCDDCANAQAELCSHKLKAREAYDGVLVIRATTAQMQNPLITRPRLVVIFNEDPDSFPRESRAEFIKSKSGFLNPEKVERAVWKGKFAHDALPRRNRPEDPVPIYIATLDPAFRKDSFTFQICHHDPRLGVVQDRLMWWNPVKGAPLNPKVVLDEIRPVLKEFHISGVFSDQYQLESLQQLALDNTEGRYTFSITGVDFTGTSKAKLCGSFRMLLNQERIKLLDNEELKTQLQQLERRLLQSGHVQIAAPAGKHDDYAMVTILGAHQCLWLLTQEPPPKEKVKNVDSDHVKMGMEQIARKRREARALGDWDE
jgi:hypothetical protein